jgi:hypothetical protein
MNNAEHETGWAEKEQNKRLPENLGPFVSEAGEK